VASLTSLSSNLLGRRRLTRLLCVALRRHGACVGHRVAALKDGTNHGGIFPVVCGVATRNLGTNRLLDAIVEDLPSPVKHGALELDGPDPITLEPDEAKELFAYVFKTKADPFAGRINFFRVYQGVMKPDNQVLNTRAHAKERIGALLVPHGMEQLAERAVS